MKYDIEIIETISRIESIEAVSKSEAMTKIIAAYENGDIELTDTNAFVDVNFNFV